MDKNTEKIKRQKKFVEIFKKNVFPSLKGYEVLRKRLYKKQILVISISIMLIMIGLIISWIKLLFEYNTDDLWFFLAGFIFPFLLIIAIWLLSNMYSKNRKSFALELKKNCLQKLLCVFGDIKWSNNENKIPDDALDKSDLFAMFNKRNIDDEFVGNYKDINFKICETTLIKESGSGKNRSIISVFNGVVLMFKLNKKINTKTIVSTKGDLTARDNVWLTLATFAMSATVPIFNNYTKGNYEIAIGFAVLALIIVLIIIAFGVASKIAEANQKVILEDVKFGKKYYVYSNDQVEARCIVTPVFMEKFLNLRTAFGAKNAKCAFYDDVIMFAISTNKNFFEIGSLNKSLLDSKTFKKLFDEINAIYDIIDYFNLDKK